eukprot:3971340-Pleurochrysis_carterae.AAC.3
MADKYHQTGCSWRWDGLGNFEKSLASGRCYHWHFCASLKGRMASQHKACHGLSCCGGQSTTQSAVLVYTITNLC